MLHGRVVRPRGQGAYGAGTAPTVALGRRELDREDRRARRSCASANFVGVVAEHEYAAIQAASQLKVKWAEMPPIAPVGNLFKQMREHDSAGKAPARIGASFGNFNSGVRERADQAVAELQVPLPGLDADRPVLRSRRRDAERCTHLHELAEPVRDADERQDRARHGASARRRCRSNRIRLTYYEGASTYGPAAAWDDVAQAAATMSALVGKPVRLQLMRWDENGWSHYGPAQLNDVRGAVDASGNLVAFEYTQFGIPYFTTNHSAAAAHAARPQYATDRPARHDDQRCAVQHPEPHS